MESWTVLIVDDDPVVLKIIEKRLSQKNQFRVLLAENGKTGLALLEKTKADTIILDHVLPDTDGLTLCKTIKANPRLQDIPILFFSSFGEFGFAHSCEAAGALRVIAKSDMNDLIEAVQKVKDLAKKTVQNS